MNARFRPRPWLLATAVLFVVAAGQLRGQFLETVVPVGATPYGIVWNETSNKVYTANCDDGTVTVIDGATNQVRTTIPVADYPILVCWNSVANKVYCTSAESNWLSVIDGVGDTLIRKVRVRGAPTKMAFNALMNKLYVVCIDDCMVRAYDGAADTLAGEVWFGEICTPYTALWHPVSNRVFCATYCGAELDTVFVIDCVTDEIAERRPVGRQPCAMCWNPVNRLVYAAQRYAIYALTPLGDSVVAQVDGYAGDVCAVPFPNKLYAVGGPGLWVIDCSTHTVVDSVAVLTGIMVCDTVKAKVYATGEPAPVFDARADTLVATIPMGRSPERICWNSTNSRVYITDHMDDVVYVVRDTSVGVREHSEKRVAFVPRQASLVGWQSLVARGFVGTLRDASGRDVARLPSGPGSLCELRAGVYFLQPAGQAMACKVVVLR